MRLVEDAQNIEPVLTYYRTGIRGNSNAEKLAQGSRAIKHKWFWWILKSIFIAIGICTGVSLGLWFIYLLTH